MKKIFLWTYSPQKLGKYLASCFLLLFLCALPFLSVAQGYKVTMKKTNEPILSVLKELEKQSGYTIFYNDNQVDLNKLQTSIDVKDMPIEGVLNQVFKNTKYTFKIVENQIVISLGTANSLSSQAITTSQAQSNILKGVVKDSEGNPIPGANIIEKDNNKNGVTSDIDGNFSIPVAVGKTLQISFVSYTTRDIVVKAGVNTINVVLEEDSQTLDQVVVVGYAVQRKVNLTGAVSAISTKDIKDRVQSNVLSAIQGTVPGVTVISRPGQTPSINFRGRGNLGSSEPLYVIDGVIADATFFSNLDANTIESVSFLKDAASSSIYGSRAAYGVVLVTTKKGDKTRMNVSYSGLAGLKFPTYLPNLVDSWQYAELMNEARFNRNTGNGKFQAYSQEQINWFKDGSKPDYYPNTKWADLVLDNSVFTTQHSVNFSGGNEKINYFAGLGYLYDDQFVPGQNNERYNFNVNLSSDLTDWLTVKAGVKYIQNLNNRTNGFSGFGNFLLVPSTMVAKQSNGEWGSIAGGQTATQTFLQNNPLRSLSRNDWSKGKNENKIYDFGFDIKPVKGLVISSQGSFKSYEYKGKSYVALQPNVKNFETGNEIPGTGVETNAMQMNWASSTRMLYTTTARYNWTNDKHDVTFLAGTSYEHYKYEAMNIKRQDFPTDDIGDIGGGAENVEITPGGMTENKLLSYFGRVNYSFLGRYLFEANFRADASSRFHKNNRWAFFPSFSAGWRISEESFMQNVEWVKNLKLRASWGSLGNINNVGNYDYFQNYNTGANYNFNDQAVKGILESKPANAKLGWETVTLTNFGIDFELFNGKLGVGADYYIKKTKDILLAYNVLRETGISASPSQNIGKVENRGFELSLTHRNTIGDFKYSISANMAINSNEITDMSTSDNYVQGGGDKINYILKTGESIGSFYGYKTNGLYTKQEIEAGEYYTFGRKPNAGDIKYVPQRKNVPWGSSISGEDRTIIGKDVPSMTYGLNINLQYKNFELSLFGQGVSGTYAGFESEQVWAFFLNSNPREMHLQRWTIDNPNQFAPYPRIYGGHSMDDYNQQFSDYQLFNSDYFRIKTISLGYMLPSELVKKWSLNSFKVFVTGENLFTFRGDKIMKDFDPEASSGRGLGSLGVRSIALGVNIGF